MSHYNEVVRSEAERFVDLATTTKFFRLMARVKGEEEEEEEGGEGKEGEREEKEVEEAQREGVEEEESKEMRRKKKKKRRRRKRRKRRGGGGEKGDSTPISERAKLFLRSLTTPKSTQTY
ncbi:hypothetical protein PoB_002576700 [Plakobranchus ocellatus]|uniref:Uncharacterized protein n=1 Tax=Plakobranchus ocellatus TaxID=259542 RepID=A0AAV3ZXH9_9GAST|nr:hypothetical protein PoB_002576700 [Plakobranchus ocellatus]